MRIVVYATGGFTLVHTLDTHRGIKILQRYACKQLVIAILQPIAAISRYIAALELNLGKSVVSGHAHILFPHRHIKAYCFKTSAGQDHAVRSRGQANTKLPVRCRAEQSCGFRLHRNLIAICIQAVRIAVIPLHKICTGESYRHIPGFCCLERIGIQTAGGNLPSCIGHRGY